MSYLHLPSLTMGDIATGTMSIWFRFSQDSVGKAAAYRSPRVHPNAPDVLDYTIPLVTFGRQVIAHVYDSAPRTWTQEAGDGTLSHSSSQVVSWGDAPCPPSYIGLLCRQGESPHLVMYFQTDTRATVQGLVSQEKEVHWEPVGGDQWQMYRTLEDVSYIRVGEPESFLIQPVFEVELDQWHHLLVSFDFTGSVDVVGTDTNPASEEELRSITIKRFCRLWFAFDDENRKGKDNVGDGSGRGWVPQHENGIITENAESAVRTYTTVTDEFTINEGAETPEYHWATSQLPMQGGPMGLPASAQFVETISHCEMAEFQFFGGLVLDTESVGDRRKFVDENGKPVPPKKTEEMLGRRPDILLHGSSNWKKGKNTGTTGFTENDKGETVANPAGQFTPVALIKKYKPEPALDKGTA